MANPELGTKRICPETGRKFYDLNHDPIVSPYTGKSYPLSFFEDTVSSKESKAPKEHEVEEDDDENKNVEIVSLEDADEEKAGKSKGEDIPDIDDDDDDEISDNDDSDTFLESDDDDDEDDVSGIIGSRPEGEEES